jgi:hypothetical protein
VGHVAVVSEELLKVLRAENGDLGQEQLALNKGRLCVVKDSPDRDEILELAAGLLYDALLSLQDNSHAREVIDFGVADNKTVNVEATSSQNTRDTREHTGLVLDQAVEDVLLVWLRRRRRSLVENVADGGRGRPSRTAVFGRERRDTAVDSLVGQSLRR